MSFPSNPEASNLIELEEEIEGDQIGSKNYRFCRIGEPVSIKHPPDSQFDSESPPSRPLAISNRFRLLFVAHSQGFCVARIKEVKELAVKLKNGEIKEGEGEGSCIRDVSIVDVNAGKVSMLALSNDDSVLAVTVEHHIHFYAVSSLLHKLYVMPEAQDQGQKRNKAEMDGVEGWVQGCIAYQNSLLEGKVTFWKIKERHEE